VEVSDVLWHFDLLRGREEEEEDGKRNPFSIGSIISY